MTSPAAEDLAEEAYTRLTVRRMLGLSERQLRAWERQGLIRPASNYGFADLIALRTLQKLREHRISSKDISRAVASLKRKLAHIERPLEELKISSDGKTISVQLSGEKMEAVIEKLRSFPGRQASAEMHSTAAEDFFQKGLTLEETGAAVEKVIDAYQQAIALNPRAAGALVNLGTVLYRLRRYDEAERHYRQAIEADPKYPLAHFNLGNLYDELGRDELAREHYHLALRLNPDHADAHFNLALMSERDGDVLGAVRHWKFYLKLDSVGAWAETARRQLERLKQATVIEPDRSRPDAAAPGPARNPEKN